MCLCNSATVKMFTDARSDGCTHRDLTTMCTNAKAIFVQWALIWRGILLCLCRSGHSETERPANGCYLQYYYVQTLTCIKSPLTSCLVLSGQVTYCQFVLVLTTEQMVVTSCPMSLCLWGEGYLPWKHRWQFRFIKPNWKSQKRANNWLKAILSATDHATAALITVDHTHYLCLMCIQQVFSLTIFNSPDNLCCWLQYFLVVLLLQKHFCGVCALSVSRELSAWLKWTTQTLLSWQRKLGWVQRQELMTWKE